MHSTEFTRLAQAADNNGWTIVAMCEIPASPGTYPSAWVIAERDYMPFTDWLVTMAVLPDNRERNEEPAEAFFTWSTYDMTRVQAQQLFEMKNAEEIRKAA